MAMPRTPLVLAALATALMAVQTAMGMALPGLYRDVGFALDAWRVNDPITLFIAASIALAALALAWRGRWWGSSSACRRSSTSGPRS